MTRSTTALLAIIAAFISCVFLAEHRDSVALTAAPVGEVATCHPNGPSGISGWTAYSCTLRPKVKPHRPPVLFGARGTSVAFGGVFRDIVSTFGANSDGDGTPESLIVGSQVPTARRIPDPRGEQEIAIVRVLPRLPEPKPAAMTASMEAELAGIDEPEVLLVPGLDRALYDTHRRVFVLPAEATPVQQVRLMLMLMRERR